MAKPGFREPVPFQINFPHPRAQGTSGFLVTRNLLRRDADPSVITESLSKTVVRPSKDHQTSPSARF